MSGCFAIALPTVGPSPSTRLKTPLGTPASCRTSVIRIALTGVNSLGFNIVVQPAASAIESLVAMSCSGQFQAVMSPQTPIGSRLSEVGTERSFELVLAQRGDRLLEGSDGSRQVQLGAARRPQLHRDRGVDLRFPLLDQLDDALQKRDAIGLGRLAERRERPPCRLHRAVDFLDSSQADRRKRRLGGRVDELELLRRRRRDPFAVDVALVVVLHDCSIRRVSLTGVCPTPRE